MLCVLVALHDFNMLREGLGIVWMCRAIECGSSERYVQNGPGSLVGTFTNARVFENSDSG